MCILQVSMALLQDTRFANSVVLVSELVPVAAFRSLIHHARIGDMTGIEKKLLTFVLCLVAHVPSAVHSKGEDVL